MDDQGLATERTALAWQRTALATTAGSAVMARLTYDRLGLPALVFLGLALVLSGWLFVESRVRYRQRTGAGARVRGGIAPLVLCASVALLFLVEMAALGEQVVR